MFSNYRLIPADATYAAEAGPGRPVVVQIEGTPVSLVTAAIREDPQTEWTRLLAFIEQEGLVSDTSARHAQVRRRYRLTRLQWVDDLPFAQVMVWPTAWTLFVYLRKGMRRGMARKLLREALNPYSPPLGQRQAAVVAILLGTHFQAPYRFVAHYHKLGLLASGATTTVLATAAVFTGPINQPPPHLVMREPHATITIGAPAVLPRPPATRASPTLHPSTWVQASNPATAATAPVPVHPAPTVSQPLPRQPTPEPTRAPQPQPLPSTSAPTGTSAPVPWWCVLPHRQRACNTATPIPTVSVPIPVEAPPGALTVI